MIRRILPLIAGLLWGSRSGVQFSLTLVVLKAMPVLIIGGFDSIEGAIVGGLYSAEACLYLAAAIFAASRVAGWCAHVVEQHDNNRLIRPLSLYTGPAPRPGGTGTSA